MLPHFLLTSSIYRCLVRIWPVWRKPHQYKPDQPGVCDHVNLKTLYKRGWVTWMKWFQIGDVVFVFSNKAEPGTSIRGAFEFLVGAQITLCVCVVCVRSVIACSCWRSLKGNRFLMCVVLSVSLSLSKSITFSKEGRGWKVGGTVTRLLFATRLITKLICWMQNKHIFLRSNLPI